MKPSNIFAILVIALILVAAGYMIWGRGSSTSPTIPGVDQVNSPLLSGSVDNSPSSAAPIPLVSSSNSAPGADFDKQLLGSWFAVEEGIDDQIDFIINTTGKKIYNSYSDDEPSFLGCPWSYDGKSLSIDCSYAGIRYSFNQVSISGNRLIIRDKDGLGGTYEKENQ